MQAPAAAGEVAWRAHSTPDAAATFQAGGTGAEGAAAPPGGYSPLCSPRKTSLNFLSGFPKSPPVDMVPGAAEGRGL